MDPLPEVITPNYDQPYTPSEQATLHNLKSEFKDNLTKSLETLQEKLRAAILDGFESKKNNSGSPARRATLSIEDAPAGPIAFKRTKATIDNLAREIDDIENLIYLIRNLNIENADLYSNTVMSRSAELVRNVFALNRYLEKWTLLQTGKELKPMEQEKEDSFDRLKEDLRANTKLDNYRLNGTYDMILNCVRSLNKGVAKNIENNAHPPEDKKAIEEKLIMENHAIAQLKNELAEIDKLEGEEAIMEYLCKSKEKLREIVDSTEKLQAQIREQARAHVASASIAPREESKEEEEDLESLVSPKFDEETANMIDKYTMKDGKLLKDFLNTFREQVKEQVLKLMALDRYLVQAAYIPFFFEEKFVSFRSAVKNDFAQENLPKMLEDFFIIADNEYWKVSAVHRSEPSDVHSAYFCYVAQNKYDFYLFRYTPSSSTIQVYMTAPPMVSVLHKHLSKLNLKYFSKNNFQITYISYYDEELGVELRNFFLQNTQTVIAKYAKKEGVSNEMRYLLYATVFMLYNTVVKETTQGLTISAGNFVTFFNYIVEFQAVFLKGKEMKPDEFARFEFCYPFIDKRRPKQSSFLLFNKADSARGKGIDSIRRDLKDNYRPNLEVFESEKGNKKTDYVAEIQGYLQRNTKKTHFVLDSPEYLRAHIAKRDKNTKDEIKVFSKFESQNLFEAYSTGTTQESSIENPLTGPSYLHFPFPATEETANLLLISLNKINNSVRVYLLDNSQSESHEDQNKNLQSFIEFLLKTFYMDQYAAKTCYIRCNSTEEIRLQYAYHYFPYTYLFDSKQDHTEKEKVALTQEALVESFEFLLNQNIPENTLDTIKACCLLYQEKISPKWRLVNYPIFWKHVEVASVLEGLTNQMTQDKLDSAIMSFSFMGAMGLKAYYIHIQIKESTAEQQESENPEQPAQPAKPAFMITLYSLSGNLDLEDREMMARIIYLCHTIGEKSIILNNSIYERNNIFLYSQPYITMTALSYLVNSSNMTPKDAFKKLTRSIVAHYEVLDSLVEYLDKANSKENLSLISSIKNSGDWNLRRKTEGPISYSLFEDMGQEADFKKRIASEVPDILDKLEIEEISKTLVEKINTSDVCMDAFAFIVDDVLVNKVITNEDNLARDREACSNLLTWIKAKKKKYEEGKRVTYNRTNIFLVLPKGLCEGNGVCIVKYILEERRVVTYHLDLKLSSDEKTTADENIKEFISNINAAIDLRKQPEDIEFTTVKLALPDALEKTCKTQYILMTSFFIWVLNQNERDRNNRVRITLGVLNEFLCKYAEELFSAQVSESRVKKQYLPLSSAFIKKNPVIEKEPALVMYVSGNLTLDQAMAIKGFIGSFKAGYLKLEEVNHAFFNFGIALKDTVKHFLLHITRKSDRFVLDIFTNNVGDCDTALEIMVKNCCLEAVLKEGEVQAREKVFLHRISVPNKILTTYMEIAGMLIAYAVCNGVDNVNKYVGMIANSPVHFVNELRNFEEKCSKNGLLRQS